MGLKGKAVVTALVTAGPIVIDMVHKYWPQIKHLLEQNPELLKTGQEQLKRLSIARKSGHSVDSIRERLAILREQVNYLHASADNEGEVRRADVFRSQLDRFGVALTTANAAGNTKARNKDLRIISNNLDSLTEKILLAFLEEKASDEHLPPRA